MWFDIKIETDLTEKQLKKALRKLKKVSYVKVFADDEENDEEQDDLDSEFGYARVFDGGVRIR